MSQLECEQITTFVSDDHPRPVARRTRRHERTTEQDVVTTGPVTGFCRKSFVGSMAFAMVVAVFSIVGGIVMANTAVDVYVIPQMGEASYSAATAVTPIDVPETEAAAAEVAH